VSRGEGSTGVIGDGDGVGLASAKRIVEGQGGTIAAASLKVHGATCAVRQPGAGSRLVLAQRIKKIV
jgi:hypothetical protein